MGGRKTPSLMGSRQSVYSHTSSAVRTYKSGPKSHKSHRSVQKWYMKPMMKSAIYTDLQRGAWHIAFYTLVSYPNYLLGQFCQFYALINISLNRV